MILHGTDIKRAEIPSDSIYLCHVLFNKEFILSRLRGPFWTYLTARVSQLPFYQEKFLVSTDPRRWSNAIESSANLGNLRADSGYSSDRGAYAESHWTILCKAPMITLPVPLKLSRGMFAAMPNGNPVILRMVEKLEMIGHGHY